MYIDLIPRKYGRRKKGKKKIEWKRRRRRGGEGGEDSLLDKKQKRPDLSYPSPPDTGHQEALRLQRAPGTHGGWRGLFWIGTPIPFVTLLTVFNSVLSGHTYKSDTWYSLCYRLEDKSTRNEYLKRRCWDPELRTVEIIKSEWIHWVTLFSVETTAWCGLYLQRAFCWFDTLL